jgi:hypothetical protein
MVNGLLGCMALLMSHTREEVIEVVQKTFPRESWSSVIELLDSYGIESYERERERVQPAILKLSEGNEDKLREFVAVAKRDYRNVLFWADNPEEAKLNTPEKRARVKNVREIRHQTAGRFLIMLR